MLPQGVEDDAEVPEVVRPSGAIDQNVVKEDKHKRAEVGAHDVVHQGLECRRRRLVDVL